MDETYISSSGDIEEYINGKKVKDINWKTNYDGKITDINLNINDEEFNTQLDNDAMMDLLNSQKYMNCEDSLMERLRKAFPLNSEKTSASKKKSRKNRKNGKRSTRRKKKK